MVLVYPLYCTVLQCTALHCTVLCCTVRYCTVVYCTMLYARVNARGRASFASTHSHAAQGGLGPGQARPGAAGGGWGAAGCGLARNFRVNYYVVLPADCSKCGHAGRELGTQH